MPQLTLDGLKDHTAWQQAGVALPRFDIKDVRRATAQSPVWLHFGAGNIFRGFIATLQQDLLEQGLATSGIIACDTFDADILDKIYTPFDNLTLLVKLKPDGTTENSIVASVAEAVHGNLAEDKPGTRLKEIFRSPTLQMASFTITEKGYALHGMDAELLPLARADMENGPTRARHAMGVTAALLLERYQNGATPIALVSMDNCSHNGEKLKTALLEMAHAWQSNGYVNSGFVDYLADDSRVACPWSMIDKITPRPAEAIEAQLAGKGVESMAPLVTRRGTYIAPFVNAEVPQYLVVEDAFPNGRPMLERANVLLATRAQVNAAERMKVTTCLNPLHTALAVFGCLLGFESIAAEMGDADLKALAENIGLGEGMPVVVDPGILDPAAFLDEVLNVRLPNPFVPDTPQRIATDTSLKIPIRFGETIKAYATREDLNPNSLTFIPLVLAGWLRYLLGVDDTGSPFTPSPDPMLGELQEQLAGITLGRPQTANGKLAGIVGNPVLFGCSLTEIGLATKVERYFHAMLAGPGAVRSTLRQALAQQ